MKKYFGSVLFALIIGFFLGKFMLNQYSDIEVVSMSTDSDNLYFLQQGVYSSLDSMKENMANFSYYIYNLDEDGYHTYVGITKKYENASKIKGFFDEKGYDIYIKEIGISDKDFVTVVEQYDLLLNEASGDMIGDICGQVLSSYEELVLNGSQN